MVIPWVVGGRLAHGGPQTSPAAESGAEAAKPPGLPSARDTDPRAGRDRGRFLSRPDRAQVAIDGGPGWWPRHMQTRTPPPPPAPWPPACRPPGRPRCRLRAGLGRPDDGLPAQGLRSKLDEEAGGLLLTPPGPAQSGAELMSRWWNRDVCQRDRRTGARLRHGRQRGAFQHRLGQTACCTETGSRGLLSFAQDLAAGGPQGGSEALCAPPGEPCVVSPRAHARARTAASSQPMVARLGLSRSDLLPSRSAPRLLFLCSLSTDRVRRGGGRGSREGEEGGGRSEGCTLSC